MGVDLSTKVPQPSAKFTSIESWPPRPPSPPTPPTPTPSSAAACSPPTGQKTFPLSPSLLLTQVLPLDFLAKVLENILLIFFQAQWIPRCCLRVGAHVAFRSHRPMTLSGKRLPRRSVCDNLFALSKLSLFTNHCILAAWSFLLGQLLRVSEKAKWRKLQWERSPRSCGISWAVPCL